MPAGSLDDNFAALDEHDVFAESIGHNPANMYPEHARQLDQQWDAKGDDSNTNVDALTTDTTRDVTQRLATSDEAISRAESGDVVGSLPLFELAAKEDPQNPRSWENLGVTQMRLGLLNPAQTSFQQAKGLQKGGAGGSLADNIAALEEHFVFSESIDHNPNMMYKEFTNPASQTGSSYDDEYDTEDYSELASEDDGLPDEEQLSGIVNQAIQLAESGNVVASLPLFESSAKQSPANSQLWLNLGVTQMRLGLLKGARKSFNTAKALLNGMPAGSLDDNFAALDEHDVFAESIGHNPANMYEEFRQDQADSGDNHDGGFSDDDDYVDDDDDDDGVVGSRGDVEALTNEAISLAENGDVMGSLSLFLSAANQDAENPRAWENLGVTQMRLGLLEAARASFNKAKHLLDGTLSESLDANFSALEETETYAESISHDPTSLFEEFALHNGSPQEDAVVDDNTRGGSYEVGAEIDFIVDISVPLGVGLKEDLVVDNVKAGGQFHGGSVRPKDVIVAAGISPVSTLEHFKEAMSLHKAQGFVKMVITFKKSEEAEGARRETQPVLEAAKRSSRKKPIHRIDGLCDDGVNVAPVVVGDRVEVRDSDGKWSVGVVESYDSRSGIPSVIKEGWDMGYEWDECRRLGGPTEVATSGAPAEDGVTLLWSFSDNEPLDLPGFDVYHLEEISKVFRISIEHSDGDLGECGSTNATVVYDRQGDLIVAAVDNFFTEHVLEELIRTAVDVNVPGAPTWDWAHIHPDNGDPNDLRKGNGFPGRRAYAKLETTNRVTRCLKPVLAKVDPAFNLDRPKDQQTLFGLVNPMPGEVKWLDSQRIPHNDVRWDLGTSPGNNVPSSYASVLPLTTKFNESGTGLWRERSTGYSLLKTVQQNSDAQGRMNPHVKGRLHPEANLLEEIPDPSPHALTSHIWAECIMVAKLRLNRFVFYDGRRLHQQFLSDKDEARVSLNQEQGRLTMNSFFWAGSK